MAFSTIVDRTTETLKTTTAALATAPLTAAVDLGTSARDGILAVGTAAAEVGATVREKAYGAVDTAVAYTKAVVSFGKLATNVLALTGTVVSFVVAPVPTVVGFALIELLKAVARAHVDIADEEVAAKKLARENSGLLKTIARYGTIPATALIEAPAVKLRLDMASANITGTLRTGIFSSRAIEDMTDAEISDFAADTDDETAKVLEAYLSFRSARGRG